ncbi:hypothetical protein BpHYR1_027131 [Brachionus plicatilis]|uniref:Uncharacterized protein n=1 Tax=Brachionus plicatilis TaxID=10195 RepID=A0A3M7QF20_BRAPC|nr:hypothetical protein BpHYR1_027131 [Brachionus plicatilis]
MYQANQAKCTRLTKRTVQCIKNLVKSFLLNYKGTKTKIIYIGNNYTNILLYPLYLLIIKKFKKKSTLNLKQEKQTLQGRCGLKIKLRSLLGEKKNKKKSGLDLRLGHITILKSECGDLNIEKTTKKIHKIITIYN